MRSLAVALVCALGICACSKSTSNNPPGAGQGASGFGGSTPPAGTSGSTAPISTAGQGAGTAGSSTPINNNGGGSGHGAAGNSVSVSGQGGLGGQGTGGTFASAGNGGNGGAAGMQGAAGTAGPVGPAPAEAKGCGDTKLFQVPDDPGATGPWAVGAKTVHLMTGQGMETVEIWYPGAWGSEAGMTAATYDLTSWLPEPDQQIINMKGDNSPQPCNCYRDLPIDTAHGPYPPVIFVHGLASFRTASLSTMTQWASRGFIVVAADHLGEYLKDFTSTLCAGTGSGAAGDFDGDINAEIAALQSKSGDFAFLGTSIDTTRIGIGGHSMGAAAVAGSSNKPNVQVIMPFAELGGSPPSPSATLKSVFVAAGMDDSVTTWTATANAYQGAPMPKRLIGITRGDHLDVTDICSQTNSKGQTSLDVGLQDSVCALGIVAGLAHCGTMPTPKNGPAIINYVSTAVLEETLHCRDIGDWLSDAKLQGKFPDIGDYEHAP